MKSFKNQKWVLLFVFSWGCGVTPFKLGLLESKKSEVVDERPQPDLPHNPDVTPFPDTQHPIRQLFKELKPTLAVRGADCLMCHSRVKSNIITDFGAGESWAYSQFHSNRWGWRQSDNFFEGTMTIVPQSLPGGDKAFGLLPTTYKEQSRERIVIAAPTQEAIRSLRSSGRLFPLEQSSFQTSSITHLKGRVECDGDIVFKDTILVLENLNLVSNEEGCRIYTAGNVFIQGKIEYSGTEKNLQITSSEGIYMGFSIASLRGRMDHFVRSGFTRSSPNVSATNAQFNRALSQFNEIIAAKDIDLRDGNEGCEKSIQTSSAKHVTCDGVESDGRAIINYKGLLLNAPWVNSRYRGDFEGSIVAEIALFSLGNFHFQSSPEFTSGLLPIFPLLKEPILEVSEK